MWRKLWCIIRYLLSILCHLLSILHLLLSILHLLCHLLSILCHLLSILHLLLSILHLLCHLLSILCHLLSLLLFQVSFHEFSISQTTSMLWLAFLVIVSRVKPRATITMLLITVIIHTALLHHFYPAGDFPRHIHIMRS